jgi:hypothetical protein
MPSHTRTGRRGVYGWSRKLGTLASIVSVASCAGVHRIEIWRAGQAVVLRRVSINGDSIRGVPLSRGQACDSCE